MAVCACGSLTLPRKRLDYLGINLHYLWHWYLPRERRVPRYMWCRFPRHVFCLILKHAYHYGSWQIQLLNAVQYTHFSAKHVCKNRIRWSTTALIVSQSAQPTLVLASMSAPRDTSASMPSLLPTKAARCSGAIRSPWICLQSFHKICKKSCHGICKNVCKNRICRS